MLTDKEKVAVLRMKLLEIEEQLLRWARESRTGGWSTHQVEPQQKLASSIVETLDITANR
jgi:hypothetical protein